MNKLHYFKAVVELLDLTLSTKNKRHLVGGGLLGLAMLFGTLAVTVMTANTERTEEENNERDIDKAADILSGLPDGSDDYLLGLEESF